MWNYVTTAVTPTPPGLWNNQYPVQAIVEVFCRPAMTSIKNTDDGTNGYILRATPRHLPSYMSYNLLGYITPPSGVYAPTVTQSPTPCRVAPRRPNC